jgi:hypothetical protein
MAVGVLRHTAGLSERCSNRIGTTPAAAGLIRVHRAAARGAAFGQRRVWQSDRPGSRRLLRSSPEPGPEAAQYATALRRRVEDSPTGGTENGAGRVPGATGLTAHDTRGWCLKRAGFRLGRFVLYGSAALPTEDRVVWVGCTAVWAIHSFTLLVRPSSRTATHPAGSGQRNQQADARIRPAPPPAGRGVSRPARTTIPSARLRRRIASAHCRSGGIRRRRPS